MFVAFYTTCPAYHRYYSYIVSKKKLQYTYYIIHILWYIYICMYYIYYIQYIYILYWLKHLNFSICALLSFIFFISDSKSENRQRHFRFPLSFSTSEILPESVPVSHHVEVIGISPIICPRNAVKDIPVRVLLCRTKAGIPLPLPSPFAHTTRAFNELWSKGNSSLCSVRCIRVSLKLAVSGRELQSV